MTAQTITSGGVNILSSTNSGNTSNSKNTSVDTDFSKYLNGNLNSDYQNVPTRTDQKANGKKTVDVNASQTGQKKQVTDNARNLKDTKKVSDVNEENDIKSTIIDESSKEISALSEKIESIVKESLNISEEELNQIMSTLGLTMIDLLNADNLKNLVLTASGETDITAVLTNENLLNQLVNLSGEMNQLNIQDFGITEEELQYLLGKNSDKPTLEYSTSETEISKNNNIADQITKDMPVDGTEPESLEQEIKFTVHKEGNGNDAKENQKVYQSQEQNPDMENVKVSDDDNRNSGNETMNGNGQEKNKDTSVASKTDQFINNLTFTTIRNDGVNQEIVEVTQMRDIVNQIVREIRINIKPDATGMELHLNPENLGKVNLSVTTKEGVLTAQFTVQNAVAKEAIESQIQILKENLNNQGVKVESIDVTVSNFTFSESNETFKEGQEQKQSKRPLKLDSFDESNDLSIDESITTEMLMNGSTVSYTA